MLLTLPVLFAFYSMLSVAIELRGAPFILQITTLSAHDPWFIWPVLMAVTMFIQQKMTPSTADPVQQKMMLIMPVMMTGMFLWAASGLVIYWTVSNVWGIAQQMITNKLIGPRRSARCGRRRSADVKNVGGGRTDQAKERTMSTSRRSGTLVRNVRPRWDCRSRSSRRHAGRDPHRDLRRRRRGC
jgi:membrane protein insertase Oxa1/YidC/SpoIIIJ